MEELEAPKLVMGCMVEKERGQELCVAGLMSSARQQDIRLHQSLASSDQISQGKIATGWRKNQEWLRSRDLGTQKHKQEGCREPTTLAHQSCQKQSGPIQLEPTMKLMLPHQ